jgi:hypothetical protein
LVAGGITVISRPPHRNRWDAKSQSKHEHFRQTGRDHFIHRVIDRPGNFYYERIVDSETGAVVRLVDEPLSLHRGRGSARATPGADTLGD